MDSLQQTIDAAWDARSELSPTHAPAGLRDAVNHVIGELDQGRLRVADKTAGTWTTHEWIKKAEVDSGRKPGLTSDMAAKMKALERENRELRQANEILRKASAYFAQAELDRRFKP